MQMNRYIIVAVTTALLGLSIPERTVAFALPEVSEAKSPLTGVDLRLAQRLFNQPPGFFDEGQQLMDREIQRLQAPQASPLLTVQTTQWQPIISKTGGFSIWMPPGVISNETKSLETAVGKLNYQVVASQDGASRFLVAHTDDLPSSQLKNPTSLFGAVRTAILARTGLSKSSDRPISLGSYTGRELMMQNQQETFVFKIYLVERRLYVLAAKQKGVNSLSENATTFFKSFQLLQ
ncbi:MAG: hypothetical protein DCF20_06155 [Pseudanabaena sp.]|nr:MAG: hypothetical protein DCF20_06155 [Pseudanabaena sp.]